MGVTASSTQVSLAGRGLVTLLSPQPTPGDSPTGKERDGGGPVGGGNDDD